MNLIVDIGNTAAKVAVMSSAGVPAELLVIRHPDAVAAQLSYSHVIEVLQGLCGKYGDELHGAIVSSTRRDHNEVCEWLAKNFEHFVDFSHTTAIPIENLYETPHTLGMDRLAAAVGAWSVVRGEVCAANSVDSVASSFDPSKHTVVVDFGTAITIDFVSEQGQYLGGNISPGMRMRFRALNDYTQGLPLCEVPDNMVDFGRTTHQAVQQGVVQGVIHEIDGYIRRAGSCNLFFTGGDAFYFAERLKSTIFANYELVMVGLNRILEHNA